MALKGIKVIEFAGLAPGPFCGMVLKDFGARVIRIDRIQGMNRDVLGHGKESIALDIKKPEARTVIHKLCANSDVLIEPFRPGVMEKLGLGPSVLLKINPGLIYARLTGYGQHGSLSKRAGHDINYLALSGVLSSLGRKEDTPHPPVNLLADFAGGGLICAFTIAMAIIERSTTGKGKELDVSMVDGAAYLGSWLWRSRSLPGLWGQDRGCNILDGGAPWYGTFKTKDGKYMSVGAMEPQFYSDLLKGLDLNPDDYDQYSMLAEADTFRKKFAEAFARKTRSEWVAVFSELDACVEPVLELDEAADHPHNASRRSFRTLDGVSVPAAPQQRHAVGDNAPPGLHSCAILTELGYTTDNIEKLTSSGAVYHHSKSKL